MARISVESAKYFLMIGIAALSAPGVAWAKSPAPIQIAVNFPPGQNRTASVNAIRVGVHPRKTRIVLDISGPTDMGFEVADDGKAVVINMPASVWKAGDFTKRHGRAMLSDFLYTPSESGGGRLSLFMKRPVRIERPFLVPPKGKRGYRLVIDAVATKAPAHTARATPAPAVSPPSKFHQLVGVQIAGNDQLPPESIQLAAAEVAQTRVPAQRLPYQVPAQRPRQIPVQGQSFPRQSAAQPFPGQLSSGVVAPRQQIRTLGQASQATDKLFYGRALLGGIFARESELSGSGNKNTTEFDAGFNSAAAVGIDLKNSFRAEAEFIYTNSSVKSVSGTANSQTVSTGNVTGNLITYSGMGNLVMELPPQSLLTPYVFAGVGVTGVFLDGVNSSGLALYNSSDFVFAMQFGAGVSMPFDDKITLEASYRFFNTFDPELQDASGDPVTFEYSSHNFMLGARYAF